MKFAVGEEVELCGLTAAALNGLRGVVQQGPATSAKIALARPFSFERSPKCNLEVPRVEFQTAQLATLRSRTCV